MQDDWFKYWKAYMFIGNSDENKYRSLTDACDRLQENWWDKAYVARRKPREQHTKKGDSDTRTGTGNQVIQCQWDNRVCLVCGSNNHIKTNYPIIKKDKDYPYDNWFINKAVNTKINIVSTKRRKQTAKTMTPWAV